MIFLAHDQGQRNTVHSQLNAVTDLKKYLKQQRLKPYGNQTGF